MEDIHRIDEGAHLDEVIEWWYFNAIFDQDCDLPGWSLIQPILDVWRALPPRSFPNYAAGSWGPKEAEELLERDGRQWIKQS